MSKAKFWDLHAKTILNNRQILIINKLRIFEERSHHTQIGMEYLPAIARRLHHCRDLGGIEPFDFLTWFEFAKADSAAFDDLVAALRATDEWKYVERESEIRVIRQ